MEQVMVTKGLMLKAPSRDRPVVLQHRCCRENLAMAEARIPGIGSGQETKEEKKKAKKILWSQYATTRSSATESQPTAVRLVSNGNLRTEHHFGVFDLVTPSVEFVELKATVVLSTKEFLHKFTLLPAPTEDSHGNEKDEEWSSNVHMSLQLISVEADPNTGKGKRSQEMTMKQSAQFNPTDGLSSINSTKLEMTFKVVQDFGIPGALTVKNFLQDEFFLKSVTIELPGYSAVHFPCDSCVYNTNEYRSDRVFFSNKVYLPHETPAGLRELREQELVDLRGDGTGVRKEADRIYDYDVYNDLGDSDQHESLKRPVLGGSEELPYPRRIRTGRPPSKTDPKQEERGDLWTNFYIPRDELVTTVRTEALQEHAIQRASRKLMPALHALYSKQQEYESFTTVCDLFHLRAATSSDCTELAAALEEVVVNEVQPEVPYPIPKVIAVDEKAWNLDEEFARERLAGLNPVVIERVREFPMRSALDEATYGNPVSAITEDHLTPYLEGMSVHTAIAKHKLFKVDYHDAYLPFVNRINECPSSKAYATRTLFFLTSDGILRPIAIELSLPPNEKSARSEKLNRVFTQPMPGNTNSLWELAKAHVLANDAGFHQLVSHWLRSHAVLEPVIIATNRQLSAMHPLHQALAPHFKSTLEINAASRKALVNGGGIIEMTFTPHTYSMQLSSAAYKNGWRFDEQALPVDLIKRGMAIADENAKHGIKLVIEDYPFAADGLELWSTIRDWVAEYVGLFYTGGDEAVRGDEELQNWWAEIRTVGHFDKKDAPGWPSLDSVRSLVEILTVIVWTASCHHAAVNFGQYEYAAFMPNHPTATRRLVPLEGTPEFEELERDPEAFYLTTVSNKTQATVIATTTEGLSSHSTHEEYLGQRSTPNWTSDDKVLEVFKRFQRRIAEIEQLIDTRNQDRSLRNRYGDVQLPYELLYPSSDSGKTGKGVPNSTSI